MRAKSLATLDRWVKAKTTLAKKLESWLSNMTNLS